MSGLGVVGLIAGAELSRRARRRARPSAEDVRRQDRRPENLYLRSFEDDRVQIPVVATSRRPFFELFTILAREPFEDGIAWQLYEFGPVTAVNDPGEPVRSLGAFREYLPDQYWRTGVIERMDRSARIVVVLGVSDGILWELGQLAGRGHLPKTILVIPPVSAPDLARRRDVVNAHLMSLGALPHPVPDLDRSLAVLFDESNRPHSVCADRRDEPSYRAAIGQAAAMVSEVAATGSIPRGAAPVGRPAITP